MSQYNVNLSFTADTGKAKAQLQDLQKQLTNLIHTPQGTLGIEGDIQKAIHATAELKTHLEAATNVNTGKLDFTKLTQSIKKSGKSLDEYASHLASLGPTGQQAFKDLAHAVAQAEIPIRRSTEAAEKLWQTLKNTARWQISSSILQGFMGAVQTAYGYAQDLNSSLNDIRIVTGQNTEQMAKFAKEANKAAKQLSTTTTQYTKASLIYYQQGLSSQEVKERTDITIKMANVARSSAEDVSDQLTAVWNNFYDGTKSLEHYADVMTALGAATASSTEEISEGLNKFAAVAETVGLSYEYAASALATVTATTRESADVVGNAFKTLFARIQSLKLGETLDDGTTLGKYSLALESVGINIKDVNGELKDMDTLLNEMGAKWDTLSKDQQVALAQSVAGVRQYTQLIALMDNWDYFQQNLGVANTSAGTLQEQADIYAESWEAAQDRVTAAAESIYQKLLNDDFFIELLNGLEKVLGFVDTLIDSLGGLQGVLTTLGAILLKVFNQQLSEGLSRAAYNVQMWTAAGRQKVEDHRQETLGRMSKQFVGSDEQKQLFSEYIGLQDIFAKNASKMSKQEIKTNQELLDRHKVLTDIVRDREKELELAKATTADAEEDLQAAVNAVAQRKRQENEQAKNKYINSSRGRKDKGKKVKGTTTGETQQQRNLANMDNVTEANIGVMTEAQQTYVVSMQLRTNLPEQLKAIREGNKKTLAELKANISKINPELLKYIDILENSESSEEACTNAARELSQGIKDAGVSAKQTLQTFGIADDVLGEVADSTRDATAANRRHAASLDEVNESQQTLNKNLNNPKGNMYGWAEGLVSVAGMVTSVCSAFQMLQGLVDVWNDKDATFGEKMLSTFSSLAMIIPMLISSFSALNLQQMATVSQSIAVALGFTGEAQAAVVAGGATASFGVALWSVLWPLGLVAIAIAAVIGVIYLLTREQEKEATATEKAAKAIADQEKVVARLNERLEETKTELEEVKSLLDEYQKLNDVFDGLVEGSVEWLKALQEQNVVVSELIDKYPELVEMGAIGIKNGLYQVLDADLVRQYAQGQATVDMLVAQIGVTGAKQNLAIAQAEYKKVVAAQEGLRAAAEKTDYKTGDTSLSGSGNSFTVSSSINGEAFKATVTDDKWQKIVANSSLSQIEPMVANTIHEAAMQVQSAMYNGYITPEDAVKYILEKDRENHGGEDYTFSYDGQKQLLQDVAEHLYTMQSDYMDELSALQEEELRLKAILLEDFRVQWEMQAQSILSNQQGFSSLTAMQKQAAISLTAESLMKNAEKLDYGIIARDREFSAEFVNNLAEVLGYDQSKDARVWSDIGDKKGVYGDQQKRGDLIKDAGDFFKETTFGDYLMRTYLEEVRGIAGGLSNFIDDEIDRDSYKITFGDNQEVTYAEVLDYFTSQAEYEATRYDEIMRKVSRYSDATLAAYTGNLQALDEETLLNSGLLSKKEDGSYSLNRSSSAYREALALAGFDKYDSSKTDLSEEEWEKKQAEWVRQLNDAVKNYDAALANTLKLQADIAKGNALITQAAELYGLDAEAVQDYAKSLYELYDASEVSYESIAKLAIANARLAKGIESLRKNWSQAATALSSYGEDSYEYYEALSSTAAALTDVFGVEVSASFIKENQEAIQKLVDGGDEAVKVFQELELAAAKDYIAHLDIDDSYKSQFQQLMTELTALEDSAEFGIGFTGTIDPSYVESLNTLLAQGAVTTDQIQAMFNSIGWNPNITYDEVPTTSESLTQTFSGSYDDVMKGDKSDKTKGSWSRIITHSTMQVPVIGDGGKVTAMPKASSSVSSTGSSGSGGSKKREDRFHYLEKSLDSAERKYDEVAKARERAFGSDKLAFYDTEIDKINGVITALDNYATEAEKMYREDRDALLAKYDVKLDGNGNISNYNDVMAKYSSDENFIRLVENYEESLEKWKEKTQEAIDKRNELFDLKLEKIQYQIDLDIKIDDQAQEYLDFLMELADDPLEDAAEKLGYLTQKINSSAEAATKMGENIKEALKVSGWSDADIASILDGENIEQLLAANELTESQIEMIESYRDQLYTTTKMVMTWVDDIKDTVIEAFDKMGEAFDESASKLEHYNKILKSYENIIGLVGKDTLGISNEVMAQLSQAQVDNSIASLQVAKEAYDMNKQALEDLRAADQTGWSDEAKAAWDEAVKHAEEKVRESEATMFDSWESALQAAADAFEKAVETAVKAYEKAMSGIHGSFDAMQTAYDRQKTLSERYVQDYEKIYQLSKLNRAVQNSIDDTDNVKAKKELAKLQKEILAMSESDAEVSQYQLDSLQKQYDLKMAQIALEEAQNAKSQVRMQRDSEGNWSYVYTADQDNIENAQQNYEDKLFAFQDFTQKYIEENSDALMQLQQEYAEAMAGIKRENYATQEEYEEALRQTTEFYESMMNYHIGEIGLATTDAKRLYEEDWSAYNQNTGYKISKDGEWIDSWKETKVALTTGYTEIQGFQDAFKENSTALIGALSEAYSTWKTNVDEAMVAAGTSMDNFAGQVSSDTEQILGDTDSIIYSLEDIGTTASNAFAGVADAAESNFTAYSKWVSEYISENAKLIASLNEVIKKKAQAASSVVTSPSTEDLSGTGTYTPGQTTTGYVPPKVALSSPSTEDTDSSSPSTEDADTVVKAVNGRMHSSPNDEDTDPWVQEYIDQLRQNKKEKEEEEEEISTKFVAGDKVRTQGSTDGWVTAKSNPQNPGQSDFSTSVRDTFTISDIVQNQHGQTWYKYKANQWILEKNLVAAYKTGGYTGTWGSDGRLAMLHQKELVLNAADTENMLKAVDIVRNIVRVIDLNAATAANAFGALHAIGAPSTTQTIEQEVTIHAEFPNATNRGEIEEAFNSLLNRASQFANRKK